MTRTALFIAVAAVVSIASTAPALADQVVVSYKDLDLATPAGEHELARRLDAAARDACGYEVSRTGTRIASRDATECYRGAQSRSKTTMATILAKSRSKAADHVTTALK